MKLLTETGQNGDTYRGEYTDGCLHVSMDEKLNAPPNSWVVLDAAIYPKKEGYRPVTEEEMKEYDKPDCAMLYNSSAKKWVLTYPSCLTWDLRVFYIVPEDFSFEPVYRKVTEEDVGKMIEVGSDGEEREFIGMTSNGRYLCWVPSKETASVWFYAKIKVGE